MKKQVHIFISLLLLLSFGSQCIAKSVIYINFKMNQDELAKTVCENKDKPKSCCAAKCQLEKEIKKEDKSESNLPSNIKDKAEKSELNSDQIASVYFIQTFLQTISSPYTLFPSKGTSCSVFHPPAQA